MGIWAAPSTIEHTNKLAEIMSSPIPAKTAAEILYNVVGDDTLFDMIVNAVEISPEIDVRSLVAYTLFEYNYLTLESEWSKPREEGVREIIDNILDKHLPMMAQDEILLKIAKFDDPKIAIKEVSAATDIPEEDLIATDTVFHGAYIVTDRDDNTYHFDGVYGLVYPISSELREAYEARSSRSVPRPH